MVGPNDDQNGNAQLSLVLVSRLLGLMFPVTTELVVEVAELLGKNMVLVIL